MSDKKSIIFINQSSGYLMVDIINAFQEEYDEITLITGDLNLRNKQLAAKVKLVRIVSPRRNSTFQRLLTWLIGYLQIFWYLLWRSSKVELFIVSNPPISVFLPLIFNNPFTILLFDIYPDALVEHHIIKPNSLIFNTWKKTNQRVFKRAKKIITLTEGMKSNVVQYVEEKKVTVIPIWTDNDFFKPIKRDENTFIKEHNLERKFVVMYSGNLGFTHNIEVLIDIANALKEESLIVLIIGEGAKKTIIQQKIDFMGLSNCLLLPWQPMSVLPHSLASAHIGVVSLGKEASTLSLPSKTFNLMSVGVPILSIASTDSELANLISKYDIGENFEDNDLNNMVKFVKSLIRDRDKYSMLSENSKTTSLLFTPANANNYVG